jgi:hypothetical protein
MAGRGKKKEKKTQFDIDMAHRAALYNPWREGGGTPDGTRRRRRENSVLKKERKKKVETFDFSVELVGKRQVSAPWPGIGQNGGNQHIRTRRHTQERKASRGRRCIPHSNAGGAHTTHTHTHTLGGKKKKEPFFLPSRMEIGMQKQRLGAKDKI